MEHKHRGFLADCEKEQLHASGAVQSHGALLVFDAELELTHRSANQAQLTGVDASIISEELRDGQLASARAELSNVSGSRLVVDSGLETDAGVFDLVLTRGRQGQILLEILLAAGSRPVPDWIEPPAMQSISDSAELALLRQSLTDWVSTVTGYERVMYYQFLEGGDGSVVAETCTDSTQGSYLGLRFPASDIPLIARNLYLKNPWRVISDASATAVTVDGSGELDLTWCDLRSVSPIHAIYMQNMGDFASFSLPVSSGQELDALLSCHSAVPGTLPLSRLKAVHEVVRRFNILLRDFRSRSRVRMLDEMTRIIQTELRKLAGLSESQAWEHLSRWLLSEFEADALVWCRNGEQYIAGMDVEPELVRQLDVWFSQQVQELAFVADSIRHTMSIDLLSVAAGCAGIRFRRDGDSEQGRLYLLRKEQVEEVSWGGNPDKPIEHHDGVLGVAPRRSFAKWVETRLGYSRPWGAATRLKLLRLRDELQRLEHGLPGDRFAEVRQ